MTCALFVDHPPAVWGHLHFPSHLPAWSVAPLIGAPRLLNVQNRPLAGTDRIDAWADEHNVVWVTTRDLSATLQKKTKRMRGKQECAQSNSGKSATAASRSFATTTRSE